LSGLNELRFSIVHAKPLRLSLFSGTSPPLPAENRSARRNSEFSLISRSSSQLLSPNFLVSDDHVKKTHGPATGSALRAGLDRHAAGPDPVRKCDHRSSGLRLSTGQPGGYVCGRHPRAPGPSRNHRRSIPGAGRSSKLAYCALRYERGSENVWGLYLDRGERGANRESRLHRHNVGLDARFWGG